MADPITREQVERAIERAQVADSYGVIASLGLDRHMDAPEYVRDAWSKREVASYAPLTAALTRWRDELVSAVWAPSHPAPAPEVVDVPQPVVKLSGDTEARWNGPGTILVRFTGPTYPGKASLTVPIALLRAMLDAIDAQQPAPVQPARPEPRYKVGDWVQDGSCPSWRVAHIRAYGQGGYYYAPQDGFMGTHEDTLTPTLDPALHETARKTVAILRKSTYERLPDGASKLPMFREWNNGPVSTREWAAQLERLLGDAP